jgi:ABC-type glutathione transport system ATPase component
MSHLDFDLYLFDEVMSVGDAEFAFKSKRKLQSLITSERSVLFVSHNVEELSNHDIFILLENGKIKEKSNKSNILLNYVEKSINQYSPDIATSAAYITDFTKYPISDDVKVNFVRFYQGSPVSKDEFKTDCEFIIEINYDKLKNTDTIDVILGIANIQDSLILSSSPFVTEDFSEDKSQATYHCRCILPPNLFHSQVYKINLFFVKNVKQQLVERQRNDISKEGYFFERALKMLNVISFKPVFLKREKPIDLSSINIAGHLLCGFNWDTKIQK